MIFYIKGEMQVKGDSYIMYRFIIKLKLNLWLTAPKGATLVN